MHVNTYILVGRHLPQLVIRGTNNININTETETISVPVGKLVFEKETF